MATRILVVEDEQSLADSLRFNLENEGYEVAVAGDGRQALELFREFDPDLILLDVMLPVIGGFEVCRAVRRESNVPVIILTARRDEVDRVAGLDFGADDYVVKPFGMRELLARIRAGLRRLRPGAAATAVISVGDLNVAADRRTATVGRDARLSLSRKEFDLLLTLVENAGRVLTRSQLLEQVWGYEEGDDRTLDVHMSWLRSKLQRAGSGVRIVTTRGVGYHLEGEA